MKKTFLTINHHLNGYSLAITVALDLVWNLFDPIPVVNILMMPVIFILCATAVTLLQMKLSSDEWQTAILKGVVLGFIAALPFSVITTITGAFFGVMQLQYGTDQDVILLGELTKAWGELERVLKSRFQATQLRGQTIDQVIDSLGERGLISVNEKSELHRLRIARNKIVHNGQTELASVQELSDLVNGIKGFSKNLERRLSA